MAENTKGQVVGSEQCVENGEKEMASNEKEREQ